MKLFNKFFISLLLAMCFVAPIYCVYIFERFFYADPPLWINSILGLISLYIFLNLKKELKWFFGFFVGILWFYWIGLSFIYFGFPFLVPLIAIVVACIYMVIFACALWSENLLYRSLSLLALSLIHPFGFDWMVIDSFFAYSYFGIEKYEFALILLSLVLWKQKRFYLGKILALASLVGALSFNSIFAKQDEVLPFSVDLFESKYSQDFKWQRENAQRITEEMIAQIESSILLGERLIILPETAFPFVLEKSYYFSKLKELSQKSTLVIGSMRVGDGGVYNSIYIFQNQNVKIVDKVVLAPFGEKIPLPQWLASYFERVFFGDTQEKMLSGKSFGSFSFEDFSFRPVVCYEGTSPGAYENAPKYMIVISNNAWFEGSIESSLQKNLMKYYARKNQKVILHSSNGSRSFILFP